MLKPEDTIVPPDHDSFESAVDPEFGQFLMRVYRGNGPRIRTVAWRRFEMDAYGPEHILFATPIGMIP